MTTLQSDTTTSAAAREFHQERQNAERLLMSQQTRATLGAGSNGHAIRISNGSTAARPPTDETPQPLRRPLPPGERFPIEALGDTFAAAATAIMDRIQCPDAIAGNSVLAAMGHASQAHADVVVPATGARRPTSLFLITVAGTGERKSSADKEASAPIQAREEELRAEYEADRQTYQREHRAYELAVSEAEKAKGDRSAKSSALEAVGDEPESPLLPYLSADEPTVEGLHKLFERGQPSLALSSDEGGAMLGGHAFANEHKLRSLAALSGLWDGTPIRRIRAGDGASVMPGRRLALHLMLQPGVATRLLSDPEALEQGLASRLLVAAPASTAGTRMQREEKPETAAALRRYTSKTLGLLERPPRLIEGTRNALNPRPVSFTPNAAAAWRKLADEIERKLVDGADFAQIRGFANKLAEHMARIAAVLTIATDPDAAEIGLDALGRAATLGDFYASEALRMFEAGRSSPEIEQAEKLLRWLKEWPEPIVSLAAIYQRGPNSIRDASTARRAVSFLESHGWLSRLEGKHTVAGNRTREAWQIAREAR